MLDAHTKLNKTKQKTAMPCGGMTKLVFGSTAAPRPIGNSIISNSYIIQKSCLVLMRERREKKKRGHEKETHENNLPLKWQQNNWEAVSTSTSASHRSGFVPSSLFSPPRRRERIHRGGNEPEPWTTSGPEAGGKTRKVACGSCALFSFWPPSPDLHAVKRLTHAHALCWH